MDFVLLMMVWRLLVTSIDRTAYPRFARVVSGRELVESFSPTDAEVSWARVGSALDNAAAEAFNSTIKVEYIHRHRFATRHEARLKISTWIVDFYNLRRRHSACDGMSPIDYERFMAEARMTQAA
ncbi:integrase core domain-containing protein [Streptosporangium sp. LJ11]|uniref:integrase core domain-containing protein n=1 Tax=Streptosporangium sp. LJ11 TaxID=3436927 RepID=UPI003F7A747B